MYKDYVMEKFEADGKYNVVGQTPVSEPTEELKLDHNPVGLHHIDLPRIVDLPEDHFARAYIAARQIPVEFWEEIFFADDFKMFLDETFPWHGKDKIKENDPRVVFFYTDRAGYIVNVCGRSFQADPKQRYLKVKVAEYRKVFNINRVDFGKKVYLTEGEFDSMFLPNAIASGDSNLNGTAKWVYETFGVYPVLVFDKEPRNKQLVNIIEDSIDEGFDVCLLPESFPGKDINEAFLSGMTTLQIQEMIDENTFRGLEAQLKMSSWKKC
jgi:hypothetical protein